MQSNEDIRKRFAASALRRAASIYECQATNCQCEISHICQQSANNLLENVTTPDALRAYADGLATAITVLMPFGSFANPVDKGMLAFLIAEALRRAGDITTEQIAEARAKFNKQQHQNIPLCNRSEPEAEFDFMTVKHIEV